MLSPELMNILVCPVCKGELHLACGDQKLVCDPCGLAFPVRDGIPVMLVAQAEKHP